VSVPDDGYSRNISSLLTVSVPDDCYSRNISSLLTVSVHDDCYSRNISSLLVKQSMLGTAMGVTNSIQMLGVGIANLGVGEILGKNNR
jgi:hypothetical protein